MVTLNCPVLRSLLDFADGNRINSTLIITHRKELRVAELHQTGDCYNLIADLIIILVGEKAGCCAPSIYERCKIHKSQASFLGQLSL